MSSIYLYLNGDRNTPSCRLRWFNYLDFFNEKNLDVTVLSKGSLLHRLRQYRRIEKGSTVVIQKRLVTCVEMLYLKTRKSRLIFDIDDSIWLTHPIRGMQPKTYVKQFIKMHIRLRLLSFYDHIICANSFLKENLSSFNSSISVIPTSPSDSEVPVEEKKDGIFRIVWTGTKANFFYLDLIADQLCRFLNEAENSELCVISDGIFKLDDLNKLDKIRNVKWAPDSESYWIQQSSLGIMPLKTDRWSAGKSAFKLLKCMKLGIPVIGTNFGYQMDLVRNRENGFLVDNSDWYNVLKEIYSDSNSLSQIAEEGRKTYEKDYYPGLIGDKYLRVLKKY